MNKICWSQKMVNRASYKLLFLIALSTTSLAAQPFASWEGSRLLLDNGVVKRCISIEKNKITTDSLRLKGSDLDFDMPGAREFSFLLNGKVYDGLSGWNLVSFETATDDHQGSGATVQLAGMGELNGVGVKISYLLYPELPVIRKQITIINKSKKEIKIESFDIEKLKLGFSYIESVVYANYGRQKHLSTYIGNWDDPLLAIHSYAVNAGILLGNEAPGVLKRTDYNTVEDNANIGLTHIADTYAFRKYIRSGDSWTSPRVFVIPYINAADPWHTMNNELAAFERKNMGLRIFEQKKDRPIFMYNNYVPFGSNFNDTLLMSLVNAAAQCGIRQFEVDCGWHANAGTIGKNVEWFSNTGDWIEDKMKFPNGLAPVFDTIRGLGMQPALWLSVGSAAATSKVFRDHPEWAVHDNKGHACNLHMAGFDLNTMCFATGWKNYIKDKILRLVKNYDLRLLKLDLSVLTSAYILDGKKSGCYALNHPGHKDRQESFIAIYTQLFALFDELHSIAPQLYIDCTFETEGKLQLIDYAFLEHAEANWLTNIGEPYPVGAYRVRNLTWWKSSVVPASSMIIGNLTMDAPDFISELKTLIGSFPVVLGDPRKLNPQKRALIKEWGDWLIDMQQKYQYDLYHQDLRGLGEPVEGGWDGWSRLNTDTKTGGIVGVFREGSLDDTRVVSIAGLDENKQYLIKLAPSNLVLVKMSGKDLQEKGFTVKMDKAYDSKIFEVHLEGL